MARFRLKSPKVKESENDVERACLDLLSYRHYGVERLQSGKFKLIDGRWLTFGYPGRPDYLTIHPDYPGFYLEVKRPGGQLNADQQRKISEFGLQAFGVAVIDSVLVLDEWLDRWEKHHQKR